MLKKFDQVDEETLSEFKNIADPSASRQMQLTLENETDVVTGERTAITRKPFENIAELYHVI